MWSLSRATSDSTKGSRKKKSNAATVLRERYYDSLPKFKDKISGQVDHLDRYGKENPAREMSTEDFSAILEP